MTYSAGGLIQAADYNGFVSTNSLANINRVLGAYGQTQLATTSAGATVSATQWAALNSAITSVATHQGTSITARTNPTAGSIITALAGVGSDLTAVNTNYLNAAAVGTQYTGWTGNSSLTGGYGSGSSAWTATFTSTISFASTGAASAFFNAGGLVKIQFGKTSTGTVADTDWNSFVSRLGTLYLSASGTSKTIAGGTYTGMTRVGGAGSATVATSIGYAQLTGTPQQLFLQYDDGGPTYAGNYVQVVGSVSGSTLTLVTYWHSDGGAGPGSTDQISGGSATTGISFGTAAATVVTYTPPESTYITNVWGTPTVASTAG